MVVIGALVSLHEWRLVTEEVGAPSLSRTPYRSAATSPDLSRRATTLQRATHIAGVAIAPAVVVARGFIWIAGLQALSAWLFTPAHVQREVFYALLDSIIVAIAAAVAACVHLVSCRAVLRGGVEARVLSRAYFRFAISGDLFALGVLVMVVPWLLADHPVFVVILGVAFAHSAALIFASHRR